MARQPAWEDTLINEAATSGFGDEVDLVGDLSQQDRRGITVVRLVIDLSILPTITSGVIGSQIFDLGIGVASEDAFVAGALPDVNVATDRPPRGWLWKTRVVVTDDTTTTMNPVRVMGDIRAKRRVDAGILFLRTLNTNLSGTAFAVNMAGLIRTVYLLP